MIAALSQNMTTSGSKEIEEKKKNEKKINSLGFLVFSV